MSAALLQGCKLNAYFGTLSSICCFKHEDRCMYKYIILAYIHSQSCSKCFHLSTACCFYRWRPADGSLLLKTERIQQRPWKYKFTFPLLVMFVSYQKDNNILNCSCERDVSCSQHSVFSISKTQMWYSCYKKSLKTPHFKPKLKHCKIIAWTADMWLQPAKFLTLNSVNMTSQTH